MRLFIVLACLLGAAVARPEAGFPYNGGHMDLTSNVHHLAVPQIAPNFQQLPNEQQSIMFAEPQAMYGAPDATAPEQLTIPEAPVETSAPIAYAAQQQQQDSYNVAYQQSSLPHVSGYSYAPEQTRVHKHIYVHVPPRDFEEEDVVQPRVIHQGGPKQKHYKIVFIKAPSAPAVRPPVVPPPPQNEEKTLIYVLHKKPENVQDIVVPTAAPTKPSKPEVFFIKYKTKKEEAPVYGPPPPQQQQQQQQVNDAEARFAELPSNEYGAPLANDMLAIEDAIPTTIQPAVEEQQQPQQQNLNADLQAQLYESPTMSAPVEELTQQNLELPESTMAPIVVEEPQHLPANNYGPPQRYFLKKRK